jgi:hypothetical protein
MILDLHGVRIGVTSSSEEALRLLSDRLGAHISETEDDPEAILEINTGPPPFPSSEIRKEFSWERSRPLWGDFESDILRLTDGASVSITNHAGRQARVFVQPETLADIPFAGRTFLLLPLLELLRTFKFFYVHGALLRKEDRGLLLLGRGGSGKSTLSAALLTAGWKLVGDDNLLFHLGPESTSLGFPFEKELSLSRAAVEQLGLPVPEASEESKIRIPLSSLPPASVAGYATPDRIFCLWKTHEDQVAPLEGSEIFQVVVEENPLLLVSPALASDHVETIRNTIRKATCNVLSLNRSSRLDLKKLAERFTRLVGD